MTSDVRPGPAASSTAAAGPAAPNSATQVSWWLTHEFITAAIADAGPLPAAGTPQWCDLDDNDPRKLLALAVAGEHWILRLETRQDAIAEAAQQISTAAPWARIGRNILNRVHWEQTHPWARPRTRKAS